MKTIKTIEFETQKSMLIPWLTILEYIIGKIINETTAMNVSTKIIKHKASETSDFSTDLETTDRAYVYWRLDMEAVKAPA